MTASARTFSESWHRVANLKPTIRSHLEIHRHHYRGELWYVLQDHSSGKSQRFTPAAYLLISLMDGRRTAQEILDAGRLRSGAVLVVAGELPAFLDGFEQVWSF